MATTTTIYCPAELRARWPRSLAHLWYRQYSQLFDRDDLRLALNQPRYHFSEWFVATHLFHHDGAGYLLEKYAYRNHGRKRQVLHEVLTEDQLAALDEMWPTMCVQPPDLFVFTPDGKFWFAEAKGPGDRLSAKQRRSYDIISELFGEPVEIFNVRILKSMAVKIKREDRTG